MLVAQVGEIRFEASNSHKGPDYICPKCRDVVVLKKGRIRIHHFAHKPPVSCTWGKGETNAHRQAKKVFKDIFIKRGLRAEVEYEISCLPNDRRADVVVWSPQGQRYAIELQHTGIDYKELEERTNSYINAGVRVIWVPFLDLNKLANSKTLDPSEDGDLFVERFSARPLERWVNGFYCGCFWVYEPASQKVYRARLRKHDIWVEPSEGYDQDGNEFCGGGYPRISKRWKELTLWGPYDIEQVKIQKLTRKAYSKGNHNYPGGCVGGFTL
jgi:Competence protein CoiA-like family